MAAITLDAYIPFDAGPGASVTEDASSGFTIGWLTMARQWLTNGPIRGELSDFAASNTAGRNITLGAGLASIRGNFGLNSAAKTVAFAANSSGNPRIDRVILRRDLTANAAYIDVLQGTPAGSPTKPALTQSSSVWEIPLYAVTLANGYTGIDTTDLAVCQDERAWGAGPAAGRAGHHRMRGDQIDERVDPEQHGHCDQLR